MPESADTPTIQDLGFEKYAKEIQLDFGTYPVARIARIVEEHRTRWILSTGSAQLDASIRGAVHYDLDAEAFPKVGDWVFFTLLDHNKAIIEEILPRVTTVARRNIGGVGRQIVVTNVDTVAIVQASDQEFSIPKMERYLRLVADSGASPLIVFTKTDKAEDVESFKNEVKKVAAGVPLVAISAKVTGEGMDELATFLKPRETIVLLGSSGAGKSTLLNTLVEKDIQTTQEVREEDGKGKHTTTGRSLFILPSGALVIDTPGMRELMNDGGDEEKKDMFEDVTEISYGCRFPNCDHEKSLGCAVLLALKDGSVEEARYKAYLKFLAKEKKLEVKKTGNQHSDRVKSNRAMLNYESRRQSEENE